MVLKSGMAAQLGLAVETTAGVPETPSIWLPLISESLSQDIDRMEPDDIIAGRRHRTSDQWNEGNITVGGDTQFALKRKAMGKLVAALIGVPVTTGGGPTYTHTYTPADLPSLTLQVGRPDNTGTVHPFTYAGMMAAQGEIGFTAGDPTMLGVTWAGIHEIGHRTVADGVTTNTDATITSATANWTPNDIGKPISGTGIPAGATIASVTSATEAELSAAATADGTSIAFVIGVALGTASYVSALKGFYFQHGVVSLGGSVVKVKSGTLSIDNGLDTDRRFLGQQYIDQPLEAGLRTVDGTLELEFSGRTQYDRFVRAAEVACVLTFGIGGDTFTVTMNVRYDGETPQVGDRGILMNNVPFTAVASGADSTALTAVLVNTDSAY